MKESPFDVCLGLVDLPAGRLTEGQAKVVVGTARKEPGCAPGRRHTHSDWEALTENCARPQTFGFTIASLIPGTTTHSSRGLTRASPLACRPQTLQPA